MRIKLTSTQVILSLTNFQKIVDRNHLLNHGTSDEFEAWKLQVVEDMKIWIKVFEGEEEKWDP